MSRPPYAIVYLHGFASSPQSAKATAFARFFAERQIPFVAPDLNTPAFADLTISRIVAAAEAAAEAACATVEAPRVCVIGSSLGGYAACACAAQREARGEPLAALMLMAPAFAFHKLFADRLPGHALEAWRKSQRLTLRDTTGHWIYGADFPEVSYALYEDALAWDAKPLTLRTPILIFHGDQDEQVPVTRSIDFARDRDNVTLRVLSGAPHALIEQTPMMAEQTAAFFDHATVPPTPLPPTRAGGQ